MNIVHFFDHGVMRFPNRICLQDATTSFTYRELQSLTHRIANALIAAGAGKGAHVAVYSPNAAVAFACILGILRAGGTWVPLNARNTVGANIEFLRNADCRFLFYHSTMETSIGEIAARAPEIKGFVCVDGAGAGAPSLTAWFAGGPDTSPGVPVGRDDIAILVGSGGTTGNPKGVMLTHLNMETMVHAQLVCMPSSQPPVNLVVAPITHAAGVMLFALMSLGATNILMEKMDAGVLLENIERHQVTTMFLPPTGIYMLLANPMAREYNYGSLQYFVYGAAPMSVEKLKEAMEVFGPVMAQIYGQAEAPCFCTFLSPEEHQEAGQSGVEHRLWSCGRATSVCDLAIMDGEGNLLPDGEKGEIVVRGNLVMNGYYKHPEQTEAASAFGWHHTGDIGYRDDEGYFYIVDRKKDMIVSGGFNIYPSEIEQVLWSHPAVEECAVVGVPDPKWGEAVAAVVQLKNGVKVSPEELGAFCRERLGGVRAPKSIELWEELPRSPVGKVLKRAIREHFWRGQKRMV